MQPDRDHQKRREFFQQYAKWRNGDSILVTGHNADPIRCTEWSIEFDTTQSEYVEGLALSSAPDYITDNISKNMLEFSLSTDKRWRRSKAA